LRTKPLTEIKGALKRRKSAVRPTARYGAVASWTWREIAPTGIATKALNTSTSKADQTAMLATRQTK
jgi:hypothetical protein